MDDMIPFVRRCFRTRLCLKPVSKKYGVLLMLSASQNRVVGCPLGLPISY